MDLRLSLSALHAVSNEFSEPADPDCAVAIETDWPINAIQGMSDVFAGPWFNKRACTPASAFWSDAAWSILLIMPMVLVPTKICFRLFSQLTMAKLIPNREGNQTSTQEEFHKFYLTIILKRTMQTVYLLHHIPLHILGLEMKQFQVLELQVQ